jgi:hypothetical protein
MRPAHNSKCATQACCKLDHFVSTWFTLHQVGMFEALHSHGHTICCRWACKPLKPCCMHTILSLIIIIRTLSQKHKLGLPETQIICVLSIFHVLAVCALFPVHYLPIFNYCYFFYYCCCCGRCCCCACCVYVVPHMTTSLKLFYEIHANCKELWTCSVFVHLKM